MLQSNIYWERGEQIIEVLQRSTFEELQFKSVFVDDFQALREDQVKFLSHLMEKDEFQLVVAGDDDVGENLNKYVKRRGKASNLTKIVTLFLSILIITFSFMLFSKAFGLKDPQIYPLFENYNMHRHIYSHARVVVSQLANRFELFGFPKLIESNRFLTHPYFSVCALKLHTLQRSQEARMRRGDVVDSANQIEDKEEEKDKEEETRRTERMMQNAKGEQKSFSRARHLKYEREEEEPAIVLHVLNNILPFLSFLNIFFFDIIYCYSTVQTK